MDGPLEQSKGICISAWKDALDRAKIIKGHELKVGIGNGFQEVVQRAVGRYDLQWKINGNSHFLDKEQLLPKFLPFVHAILGKFIFNFIFTLVMDKPKLLCKNRTVRSTHRGRI